MLGMQESRRIAIRAAISKKMKSKSRTVTWTSKTRDNTNISTTRHDPRNKGGVVWLLRCRIATNADGNESSNRPTSISL